MHPILLFATWIWAALPLPAQTPQAAPRGPRPPNIVFFLVDDLGWRDVACYGSNFYETPHIDQLSREGVRFTQAYAACHVCSPTRASILTGKYPARLHLTDWLSGRRDFPFQKLENAEHRQHLPFEESTLAEALAAQGYATAIFGKWHLGEEPSGPSQHGFDLHIPRWNKGWPRAGYHAPFRLEGLQGAKGDYLTDRLTDEALVYIEKHKERPFFLYLSHFAVHDPIQGRADLVEKYRKKLARLQPPKGPAFALEGNPDDTEPLSRQALQNLITKPSHQGFSVLPQRTVKIKQHQDNAQFAAMVEAMDESLGRVMATLKRLELEEHTIVIFFSDNGGMSAANFGNPKRVVADSRLDAAYSTSNLPLRGAKGWLYEGGIRVPMIVKWPQQGNRGSVCTEPVISTDFYPSILEMAGLPALLEQHVDGISFVPALKGEPFERKAIYWHFPHYSNHGMQSPGGAIRLGDFKLLEYFENNTAQLFNLQTDPGEQHDLAKARPKKTRELLAMLHAWRQEVSAMAMPRK
ncbi:MAG: sulfatase [Planctomycetota bacterium]|jgi:arylsulfatase A-like enzyme|nr:sulfatase [Planctomycetota bacterium]